MKPPTSCKFVLSLFSLLILAAVVGLAEGESGTKPKLHADLLAGIKLRNIGPALMSGRISDLAVDPERPSRWYVAVGSGGVWKTENAGTTWKPIFDNYGSYSIGCVALDPSDPATVWVGTGEAVGGRHVGYGDGVYRSRDGGESFENLGLGGSEHIAKILIDPRDSQVVYVAAQGPLWSAGGERGLYKTTDGGANWTTVLSKGPYTGVTDVVFEPGNPEVLFAATHQRHRTVWALVNGGPESGIHKSVDGGCTWRELKSGLPGEDLGKIALAVSPQRPQVVYASIELAGREGGFWRSEDGGESWSKRNDLISGGTGPHYYQEIFCDPHRFDVVYQMDVQMDRTEDGGLTWDTVESPWKHVDNHALAFHPTDPDFLLVGCDGGLYRSFDRGLTFDFFPNLPLTQFYKVDVDYDQPFYHVVGGTQDNSTQYGPARTDSASGIRNSDWRIVLGGDGHDCAIDPEDPDIIYAESQQGYLRRHDRRTGETTDIRPRPGAGEEDLRFNWDSPILISPHSHTRLYFGSKKLHRSDDRGDSWRAISPDLSRGLERYGRKHMDRVWSLDAVYDTFAMSQYGNLTSISESPLVEGLIYVGTDDGLIQVTEDGGATWRRIERIYGVPEEAFVNDVKADRHDPDTVYAVLDHHKTGDYRPYLVRSRDRGQTWSSIVGDLPERQILWRFIQDHAKPDLYFLGAEFGLYCTLDGGEHWIQLKGDVPVISFRDLEIQRREDDLVCASFGRSFFVFDDYSFLRGLNERLLQEEELILFPVRAARLFQPRRPLGGEKGSQGDRFYNSPNPPHGAVFTLYLRDTLKTARQERQEREKALSDEGRDVMPPAWEVLEEEEGEDPPAVTLVVRDDAGRVVNRIAGPTTSGLHRVQWNLCFASPATPSDHGPWVTPGTYRVEVEKRVQGETVAMGGPVDFEVVALAEPALPNPDRGSSLAFYLEAGRLQNSVRAASGRADELLQRLGDIRQALQRSQAEWNDLDRRAGKLEEELRRIRRDLTGDTVKSRHNEPDLLPVQSRISGAMSGQRSTYGPTITHRRDLEIAREQYDGLLTDLRQIAEEEYRRLEGELEAAGIPWTAGRPIPDPR